MADHFAKVAAKRKAPSKLSRVLSTGQFAAPGPLSDPHLKGLAVNAIRACDDLRPFLVALGQPGQEPTQLMFAGALLAFQDALKANLLAQLSEDPDAVSEARKKRLVAPFRFQVGGAS